MAWACCATLFLVLGLLTANAGEPALSALTARQILDRMANTYQNCKTYRDSGSVKIVFVDSGGKRAVERPFTTAFVRPDQFRYEYKDKVSGERPYDRYIVWAKGKEVKSWWDVAPGVKRPESLGLALASATGVSGGSAHNIPALLLPKEVGGGRLNELTALKRLDDARLDDAVCFRVQGNYGQVPRIIWIDQSSFLIRRVDQEDKYETLRIESATTYTPAINEQIPAALLEFDAPASK